MIDPKEIIKNRLILDEPTIVTDGGCEITAENVVRALDDAGYVIAPKQPDKEPATPTMSTNGARVKLRQDKHLPPRPCVVSGTCCPDVHGSTVQRTRGHYVFGPSR